ncbi:unnamed protein product [Effrenium voratum]|nr:unnamed protein product [Effrenium voratum]
MCEDLGATHFDELDWRLGFTELWLYALRCARLALRRKSFRRAEARLQKEADAAFSYAREVFDEYLADLRALAETRNATITRSATTSQLVKVNSSIKLSNGLEMPSLGLGTTMLNGPAGQEAMVQAFALGYRLVDTAQSYDNEAEVGAAISGQRERLFVATKLSEDRDCRRGRAKALVRKQLKLLQTDYIDQYMLHGPCPGMVGAWMDLEELYDAGVLRSLGVSNFDYAELMRFSKKVRIKPQVVQNKFSVYHRGWAPVEPDRDLSRAFQDMGVVVMGYCNLDAYPHVLQPLEDFFVRQVAQAVGRSAAQVLLRHALQHGTVVIPKSERKERLIENADVFSFHLSQEEMQILDALPLLAYSGKRPSYVEDLFGLEVASLGPSLMPHLAIADEPELTSAKGPPETFEAEQLALPAPVPEEPQAPAGAKKKVKKRTKKARVAKEQAAS